MSADRPLGDPATLARGIAEHELLLPGGFHGARRIGAEVEFLLVDADTRLAVPITAPAGRASFPFLCRFGARRGWAKDASGKGAPAFLLPDGTALTYEPGGQIEIRTPPERSASAALDRLRRLTTDLVREAAGEGIAVLGAGIDPLTPLERVPLQVDSSRYSLMDRYLRSIGPWGARMMRQTAAVQLNIDFGPTPLDDWQLANALAPFLVALFANSPRYGGEEGGARSVRSVAWRRLDPSRTGLLTGAGSPGSAEEYTAFALGAGAIFHTDAGGGYHPFGAWLESGELGEADWRTHLTTLFPEVRPKGYLEVRSIDALPPEWLPAALAVACGLFLDAEAGQAAAELLGAPDPDLLEPAARLGMAHPVVGPRAAEVYRIALEGCRRVGEAVFSGRDLEIARAYGGCYAERGRSPADDVLAADAG